jgi:hypothetical protein
MASGPGKPNEEGFTMRNRFGRALCGLAAAAAVTTAIGMTGAGAASAAVQHLKPNATAACGDSCINVYSALLGEDTIMNAYVPGNTGTGGKVGQDVNMKFASNTRPNEDFTDYAIDNGTLETVADFCDAWPAPQSFNPTSYVCQNYYDFPVFEASWSPFGNESGLCAGVAKGDVDNENVTLQDCGASDNTLWILDLDNAVDDYAPAINGSDTNFSHPLVLTVNAGSSRPDNQLLVQRENLLTGGTPRDNQLFDYFIGEA